MIAPNPLGTLRTLLVLLLGTSLLFGTVGVLPRPAVAQSGLPVVMVFSNTYGAANVTDPTIGVGNQVTFEVNVVNAPLFNAFEFVLYYDSSFLQVKGVDVRTGTVFNNPFVAQQDLAVAGTVRMAVVNLGSSFDGGFGTLLHVFFDVTAIGVSPLVLAAGTSEPSSFSQSVTRLTLGGTPIAVDTSDGYFRNEPIRLGPVADFNYLPVSPLTGNTLFFNATNSFDADSNILPDRGISYYSWDFGDGSAETTIFPVVLHRFGESQPGGFNFSGNFSVRLTVTDSDDGFEGMKTLLIAISPSQAPLPRFTIDPGSTLMLADGSFDVRSLTVYSLGGFAGTVALSASSFPVLPSGLLEIISPTSVSLPSGGSAQSSLETVSAAGTPPGRYVVIITGASGSMKEFAVLDVFVFAREPVFAAKMTWTRQISVSTKPLEVWTAKVANPNPVTPLRVSLRIVGTIVGVAVFTVDSVTIVVPAEQQASLSASRVFPAYQAGLTFGFTAYILWSFVPGMILVSSSTQTGSVTVRK